MGEYLVGHLLSSNNIAELMMKVIYWPKEWYLVSNILYDIIDDYQAWCAQDDS